MEISEMKQYLRHDSDGKFYWIARHKKNNKFVLGAVAGRIEKNGYIRITIGGKRILAHRLAWAFSHGSWPVAQMDHIDGDRANNRIENLRVVTNGQNGQNKKATARNNKLGLTGVSHKTKNSYQASIHVDGATTHLGSFKTAEEAHAAYLSAKKRLHPFWSGQQQ
jgi:hypothetical protein